MPFRHPALTKTIIVVLNGHLRSHNIPQQEEMYILQNLILMEQDSGEHIMEELVLNFPVSQAQQTCQEMYTLLVARIRIVELLLQVQEVVNHFTEVVHRMVF